MASARQSPPLGMPSICPKWRGVRRGYAEPLIDRYQPACKPGSVGPRPLARARRDGHSSGTMLAHGLEQPTRIASLTSLPQALSLSRTARVAIPIRSCSRWGLPCRFRCRTRGALLPHLFTLTRRRSYGAASPEACRAEPPKGTKAGGSFSVALSLGLPPPGVIRHRMSMEPGLSSPSRERPSGRLTSKAWGLWRPASSRQRREKEPKIIIVKMSFCCRFTRLVVGDDAVSQGVARCNIC
jgi:hypothetical protein